MTTDALAPRRAMKAPRRSLLRWGGFVHLLARFYMNYLAACVRAAHRKRKRSVDIDTQPSKQGTPWALHWATLRKNKLHDPKGEYGPNTRIDDLTDEELERMRGPKGQKTHKLLTLLIFCAEHKVRVEVELKSVLTREAVEKLLANKHVARMNADGLLQFKTLAFIGAPNGPVNRLRAVHDAGGKTILSFTDFRKRGISKSAAWPVTDYVRGRAKWVA